MLNRRLRTGNLATGDYDSLVKAFAGEWRDFAVIDIDEIAAGRLTEIHCLRGSDTVHLSACKLLGSSGQAPAVAFSSFDEKPNDAAAAETLALLLPRS